MATVTVDPNTSFQTFRGWEADAELGESFQWPAGTPQYPTTSFANYKSNALSSLLDIGINRLRVEFRLDDINSAGYSIDSPFPNAIQPSIATSGQFHYDRIHQKMDSWVTDYRNSLINQGESLWINMCLVDFRSGGYQAEATASEISLASKKYIQDFYNSYGYMPNSFELCLEADNQSGGSWTTTTLANYAVQLRSDLQALDTGGSPGFGNIPFVTPSTAFGPNWKIWLPAMKTANASFAAAMVAGSEYSYHRYGGFSNSGTDGLQALSTYATADGLNTSMLEFGGFTTTSTDGATYLDLYEDLVNGNVVAWQMFTAGFPNNPPDDVANNYLKILSTSPWTVSLTSRAKYLRHFMKYIRRNAVRKGGTSSGTGSTTVLPVVFRNANGKYVVVCKCTAGVTFDIAGLPNGTYKVKYTTGDGAAAPSAYDQSLSDQVVSGGNTGSIVMPAAGVITIYDQNYLDPILSPPGRRSRMLSMF